MPTPSTHSSAVCRGILCLLLALVPMAATTADAASDALEEIAELYLQRYEQLDFAGMGELLAADAVLLDPTVAELDASLVRVDGREAIVAHFERIFAATLAFEIDVEQSFVSGNHAVFYGWLGSRAHGDGLGIPGKELHFRNRFATVLEIVDGKVVQHRDHIDYVSVAAQLAAQTRAEEPLDAGAIDAIFAEYDRDDAPGCAVGVVRAGELAYRRGYGIADLDHGVPIISRSVFRIASTSKQFTAAAIALAARQGHLALDDDVRKHLPELPAYDEPVTLRQLIHHTSGYRDYLDLTYLAGMGEDDHFSEAEVLDLLARQRQLDFAPGSEHSYSNSGYFLLSQVIHKATGKTLREYADEHLFQPLGMTSTHFHDDHTEIVSHRATGYAPTEKGEYRVSITNLDMVGDGGLFTTIEDLSLWDRNFYDNRLGAPGLPAELTTPGQLADGEALDYAFGLVVDEYQGHKRVLHGGAFVGYRAEMMRFPENKLSVICLCNRSDADPTRLAQKVADLFLDRYARKDETAAKARRTATVVKLIAAELAGKIGTYRRRHQDRLAFLELAAEQGRLIYVSRWGGRYPLTAYADGRFVMEEGPVELELRFRDRDAGRPLAEMRVPGEKEPRLYDPIATPNPSLQDLERLAGEYTCAEIQAVLELELADEKLFLKHKSPHESAHETPLVAVDEHVFESAGIYVEVVDNHGVPAGLNLQTGRVRNIRCERPAGP